MKKHLNYYPWLTNEEYGNECKQKLVDLYEKYYNEKDVKNREDLFKQIEIYLAVVCDVIAYRYLVKHYTNLFYKLCITVEEYMEYKVERLLLTIKDKEEHIDDILSYIYMSFMLSSPRLIYDYGEKIGRCELVKENLPYYRVARNKFFDTIKEEEPEHIIFNVDTLSLDEDTKSDVDKSIHSNLDKFSYFEWKNRIRSENDGESDYQFLINKVTKIANNYSKSSKDYILNLLINWKSKTESDYQEVRTKTNANKSYSLIDYIKYKYENKELDLDYESYLDVLKILNDVLRME